ncbi:aldehyde dehydrogenase [Frankia sp. CNm7]|uniref:Aldehyde dehydrogenase n=1 Tax=Frankia nepalensis TaxID=1836974 RepID=A0A937UMT5_9ACTN|nr:aldehyde dehydrogenase family protein [Frankia nepalensis]MBL7496649.1 aldehyde dehydrogenase [Frankia nepalensis]MBL7510709.1 aldehyde dehydrogenase [Frankia nepalensis]MBL7516658.1 aldehyde dehydrogenase [Frankia nepalensis]MBL7627388.1 aldehyde dehydrogenase [Frankia nepalensis]
MAIAPQDRVKTLRSGLVIGDQFVEHPAAGFMEHVNPATGKVQKEFAIASRDDVDAATAAARAAFVDWRRWQPDARRDVLNRLADLMDQNAQEFGVICTLEVGSPFSEYNARYVADWLRYYAGWADKISGETIRAYPSTGLDYTVPEPVGVVGLIVPGNGPLGFCGMGGAPALAAGCTLVIKTPEVAPFSPVLFAQLAQQAGIPAGVVNVVTGGPDVGDALVRHPDIAKIVFTGGTATARKLQAACAETLKPMVMELGGKSANIVFPDADLARSSQLAARFTGNAGQGCTLPTRLMVHESVYDEVVEGLLGHVAKVVVGDPFDPATTMGPVINGAAVNRILGMVDRAATSGAGKVLTGGGRVGGELAGGFFVEPTVLGDVDPTSQIAQEEVFGPVLCVIRFGSEEEAVRIANSTGFGLAAYAQTNDMARAHRLVQALEAGSVHINGSGPGPISPAHPFGGIKQSGYGRQGGLEGIREFLHTKNVLINV